MILSVTKQVTYEKERKVLKKMFSTEDDEMKTNERIKDKYRNCILIQYLGREAQLCIKRSYESRNQGGMHSDNEENVDTC